MFCTRARSCARAHVRAMMRALMTQNSCAVGMRNAKIGNHLNNSIAELIRTLTKSCNLCHCFTVFTRYSNLRPIVLRIKHERSTKQPVGMEELMSKQLYRPSAQPRCK